MLPFSSHATMTTGMPASAGEQLIILPWNDIDALRALSGAHKDLFIFDKQILAFNEFDTHLLC